MTAHKFGLTKLLLLAFGLFACVVLTGCGKSSGDVTGTVHYQGKPLKGGSVTFAPADGQGPSFTTLINEDGTYTVEKVLAGEYKVCVDTEMLRSKVGPPGMVGGGGSGGKGGGGGQAKGPPSLVDDIKSGKIKNQPPPGTPQPPADSGARPQDGTVDLVENAKRYVAIPARYSKPESTDISFSAKGSSQTFAIDLKGP
jgi:hypothetical protein